MNEFLKFTSLLFLLFVFIQVKDGETLPAGQVMWNYFPDSPPKSESKNDITHILNREESSLPDKSKSTITDTKDFLVHLFDIIKIKNVSMSNIFFCFTNRIIY